MYKREIMLRLYSLIVSVLPKVWPNREGQHEWYIVLLRWTDCLVILWSLHRSNGCRFVYTRRMTFHYLFQL